MQDHRPEAGDGQKSKKLMALKKESKICVRFEQFLGLPYF